MDVINRINIGLYKMGMLNSELYITPMSLLIFLVATALMISYQLRYMKLSHSKRVHDDKYFATGLIIFLITLLIALKAYIGLLVIVLLTSFYVIVLNNEKYKNIKSKFDKLF